MNDTWSKRPFPPVVVKLGGSLARSGRIAGLLKLVTRARVPVVLVPGGGVFSDLVRSAQEREGFSDAVAHDMAIEAMHRMAEVFLELQPGLACVESADEMKAAWDEGRVPVWLPENMCRDDDQIPRDWSITSDGLAARLAERLGASLVVLVKSRSVEPGASLGALAKDGIVDPQFGEIVARSSLPWRILGPGEEADLARILLIEEWSSTEPSGHANRR